METGKELLSPCGLYCGNCGIRMAHHENNQKLKERLASIYGTTAEEVCCEGCLSDKVWKFCRVCPIKSCTRDKGLEGCHRCEKFPCGTVNGFPFPEARKVMLRAIPQWRDLGTEEWVRQEEQRCLCPGCGTKFFRGARRCRNCGEQVGQD